VKANNAMRWEGDGIVTCVDDPTKNDFHGRPAGIPFLQCFSGCGFLTVTGVLGVDWADDGI
jgi:hypothetical protein